MSLFYLLFNRNEIIDILMVMTCRDKLGNTGGKIGLWIGIMLNVSILSLVLHPF